MHTEQHPLSGKTVTLNETAQDPARGMVEVVMHYRIEDWWDLLTGESWMGIDGNPATMQYIKRTALANHVPVDDEVVYGHIGGIGHLVHVSELGDVVE